ncbi:UDP-2-acetamido-2-deoxy-3-oxo-D-glucuronate aminotransferase [bioreactor metagenome]|uniref:UDP-2-acetamido-2-deoxy-3-oxo-D-glucuronate aminotransferase n=1 Tax=bioreactor metagenome TaxID=1076179 RepID=A0A645ACG8_9ZZZZ|nr:DegT/DnrJ/EryC1/StrS family aminotransferase [Rikenellaceae bacterium]
MKIPMLDLRGQYLKIKEDIDRSIQDVVDSCSFINGPAVHEFEKNLAAYLGSGYVVGCANGTDALQVAMMALGLKPGDEVIVPSFTFAATAEVVGLLGLVPVLVDVDESTFNIDAQGIVKAISPKTKAIVPVHLFGQAAPMEEIMKIAREHSLFVIEDNAQALGAKYTFADGTQKYLGTIGHIGCTSFFPTKNLGCYGDGGAIFTQDSKLAASIKMVTDHGQKVKYHHDIIGCNSRLDSIQAAILNVKLQYLDRYSAARYNAALIYKELLSGIDEIVLPTEVPYSNHVYHQFTIRVKERDKLREFLASKGIASMTYYPLSLNKQEAFMPISAVRVPLDNSEKLASEVLSLPMHTELNLEIQHNICEAIKEFYKS